MAVAGAIQPEYINISPSLRLRKYTDDCLFALDWYQDSETLMMVDGVDSPYDAERLYRMYHYLEAKGEVYFIEIKENEEFVPIGDVTLCENDMPIVIGVPKYRNKGIGRQVVGALIERAVSLGFKEVFVGEIFSFNISSQRMFESLGFKKWGKTEKGFKYALKIEYYK